MKRDRATEPHRGSYRDAETHSTMLRDVVRTSSYMQAINAAVKPGSRVIDFGTGTGTLAIFAARAGAARVDAIDREPFINKAREIAQLNGCDTIVFHHGDAASFQTDGPVDLIVSEWMGHCLFYESMLEPLIALRDQWLKPGGEMLPKRVTVSAALVIDEHLYDEASFLQRQPYGIDFTPIADLPVRQGHLVALEEFQVMEGCARLCSLDMATVTRTPEQLVGRLVPRKEVPAFGLAIWFDAMLDDDTHFGTGPHHAPTHWQQIFLPFTEPLEVSPTRPLEITVKPPRSVEDTEGTWAWTVTDGTTTIDVDEEETFARTAAPQ